MSSCALCMHINFVIGSIKLQDVTLLFGFAGFVI